MAKAKKFGAFSGVFTPSILAILGVIMYLRLPWIVGQAGLWSVLGIILVAHIISVSTGLSVASVATDKRVETGGSYYIISRSLGLPIGGTLGVALFVGLSFSVSLYLLGFAETLMPVLGLEPTLNNIRLAGTITLLAVTVITFISTSLAIKAQYLIMGAIILSLLSIFAGSHDLAPRGPLLGVADGSLPWIALFAIFFPAVTGFQAGVSMSGDLKDPRKDIPLGTIMAILVGLLVYVGLTLFFAFTVDRQLLMHDPGVLFSISRVPALVVAGILAATLSSGMVSILGAPRILQAVARDRILPGFFARGHGVSNEPRNALAVAFLIALAGILIGELNVIARIVTTFFIIIYGFLNITYAIESWAGSDFRPSFKIPRFVSIIGALACIVVMIQLDLAALIVASVVLIALFLFLKKKELNLQSGDTWTGVWSSVVKTGLARLSTSSKKLRNWRPNVMLFSGGEKNRPHLVEMAKALVGKMGVFTNFELTEHSSGDVLFGVKEVEMQGKQGERKDVFTRRHTCRDVYEGIDLISRVYGFTGFEPNTILMGWPRYSKNPEKLASLLSNLKRQDYNLAFLSYDKDKGFGACKSIDFWWTGSGRCLLMSLLLLRFITSSQKWRTAKIRILVINNHSSHTDATYSLISQMLENYRIQADIKVVNNAVEQLPDHQIIGAESGNTDLTILELPHISLKAFEASLAKANKLADSVGNALFVHASGFFDEISVLTEDKPDEMLPETETQRPSAAVFQQLSLSSREIIANQVHNLGQRAGHFAEKYFESGPERMLKQCQDMFPELEHFMHRNLDGLERVLGEKNKGDQQKAFLRLLNDFAFHAQRQMQLLREHRLPAVSQTLQSANETYLDALRAMINVMPEKIRIRLTGPELAIKPHDGLMTRLYKLRKRFITLVTRHPVTHKVDVLPAARYFLYHKRLKLLQDLMVAHAKHSFGEVVEIRKTLYGIYELIEKARLNQAKSLRTADLIRMERSRMKASLEVLENENRSFYYDMGRKLYEGLLHDLELFSHHLESTGANIRSGKLAARGKEDPGMVDNIMYYPSGWQANLGSFINKANIDFIVLSLKSRIQSKMEKFHYDLHAKIQTELLQYLDGYERFADELLEKPVDAIASVKRLEHEDLQAPHVSAIYQGLYAEVGELLTDLPGKMEVAGEQLAEKMEETAFEETEKVEVRFRKTVEYYLSTAFIDPGIKHAHDAGNKLREAVATIKDMVRLLNFSLDNETKDDSEEEQTSKNEQTLDLVKSFTEKVQAEKVRITKITESLEEAFSVNLRKAFEPLSAATISKSSLSVRKKPRDADGGGVTGQLAQQWERAKRMAGNRFVSLLYGKSEGQLWISHFERQHAGVELSNREMLSFAEAVTPTDEVIRSLPFYYGSLFSGQSGASDDFWVGMQDEMQACATAIQRFKAGFPGALIITGGRTSGKSSLSRRVVEKHFSQDHIHPVRAPQACSADGSFFVQKLLETFNAKNRNIDDVFRAMPPGKAIIIQDLGLWWERRTDGDAIIRLIIDLIDRFGHKCLFVLNVNPYALELINRQTGLSGYALATVNCEPFDARELRELIMLRHHAGGMRFTYKKKREDQMTALDQARMFNALFNLSYGNPGLAMQLWLASVTKVTGTHMNLKGFHVPSAKAFDTLTPEQWFYLQQFVINRRITANTLAANLQVPVSEVSQQIRRLMRAGILTEKFDKVYAIRPGLDLYLTEQLQKKKRI